MFRQTSNRNQRAKGFKMKNALQICVLVVVCIWLLYQVKHSHDKKKALEEMKVVDSDKQILMFGRKVLPHAGVETVDENEMHEEEEEGNEETETEIETEPEPEELEPDTPKEENEEEEGRGAGDDEIDENDQEIADDEAERGEELGDDEENVGKPEDVGLLESNDHDKDHDNGDTNTQEAREVHYNGDDASSAVVRENETIESETENLGTSKVGEEQTESLERKRDLETDDRISGTAITHGHDDSAVAQVLQEEGEIHVFNNTSLNEKIPSGRIDHEDAGSGSNTVVESNDQIQQQSNLAIEAVPNDQMEQQSNLTTEILPNSTGEMQNNSTAVIDAEDDDMGQQNETVRMESDPNQNSSVEIEMAIDDRSTASEKDENSNPGHILMEEDENASNTNKIEESANSDNKMEESENSGNKMEESESGANKTEESVVSSTTLPSNNDGDDAVPDESNDSSNNVDAVTEEEKDSQTDLSTLPETQTDTTSIEEIAAE